ncbi:hypothetical protein GCM10025760_19690 [Microbacterium yannicii]|uniref:Uncharacterized protein n=1 Tax=Microbacterium yannicii TaxID=671622 RepID=A0ABP9M6C2_9MICO
MTLSGCTEFSPRGVNSFHTSNISNMRNPPGTHGIRRPGSGRSASVRPAGMIHKDATPSIRVLVGDYVCLVLGSEPQGSPGPIV